MSKGLDLYSTSAQVIPLLLGLLAFELRAFALHESARGGSPSAKLLTVLLVLVALLLILLLALGEVAAIHVLARGVGTTGAHATVLTALFAGGLLLVLGIVETTLNGLVEEPIAVIGIASRGIVVVAVAAWLLYG